MAEQDRRSAFRRVAGAFPTGVGVVTSTVDDIPMAMTVNAFTTVSLQPILVLICLKRACRLLSWIELSQQFTMTVLGAGQERVARWFADSRRPSSAAAFAGIPVEPAPVTGGLVLSEGVAYFDCEVRDVLPQGDHCVLVGEAVGFGSLEPAKAPLIFHDGGFRSMVAAATPHDWVIAGGVSPPR